MALLRCNFFSEALEISTSMTVILPQVTHGQIGMEGTVRTDGNPVLYLLHGLSDNDTIWSRRTSIERYAAERGLAVVMPNGGRSFYVNEVHGSRYGDFLTVELPALVAGMFHVSAERSDTFVAGLSMGGYGAMRWALTDPGRFAAAASLSGVLDYSDRLLDDRPEYVDRVFGGVLPIGNDNDPRTLLARADTASLPDLYVTCGTQDFLIDGNRRFVADAEEIGARITSDFRPGIHDWAYWDMTIQDVLAWLPLQG